jgi:hypothetical protein
MKLYLDEDSSGAALLKLLRQAQHDVQSAVEVGRQGHSDAIQLTHAIEAERVILTKNYSHFEELHELILTANGRHPGIIAVYSENNPRRDMTLRGITIAIGKLGSSGMSMESQFCSLNEWRS